MGSKSQAQNFEKHSNTYFYEKDNENNFQYLLPSFH